MKPLVSVVMPLFNAADTVLFALASLQSQTCADWECIVVNDGSNDDSGAVVQALGESRIQYDCLDRNYGRGYARQAGVEMARGKYIAFLDADDWIYPDKLAEQVELLESEPQLAVVSTGMAIVDASDQLAGVRGSNSDLPMIHGRVKHIGMPPVAFAPSMMAASLAKAIGFDSSFPIAEDTDFLVRALYGREYAVLSAPLYVYREHSSVTPAKVRNALDYCCVMLEKQFPQHPMESAIEIAKTRGKQLVYHSAAALGLWDYMIRRRSRIPNDLEFQQHREAWRTVSAIATVHSLAV